MEIPFFSIVIPVFNRGNLVGKSIKSVLGQDFVDFELILVDDCSTDNTLEVIETFHDSRIIVVKLPYNLGNAGARNEGWKSANSNWIIFLDSDDWFESQYLSTIQKWIHDYPSINFFWTGVRRIHKTLNVVKTEFWQPKKQLPSDTFFDELKIGTGYGLAIKKTVLIEYRGFNEIMRVAVDREFFLRISEKVGGMGISQILVNCLMGDHISVRKNYHEQSHSYGILLEKYKTQIELKPSRKIWWYHKAMWLSLYCNDFSKAKQYLREINYPIKSCIVFLIFIFFPNSSARFIHKKLAR